MRNMANSEDPDIEMPHNVTINLSLHFFFFDKELQFYFLYFNPSIIYNELSQARRKTSVVRKGLRKMHRNYIPVANSGGFRGFA